MTPMADEHTGGMIALIPRAEDAAALVIPGGEKADAMHLTLAYLGDDVSTLEPAVRNSIIAGVAEMAAHLPAVEARVFGGGVFNPDGYEGREPCSVYLVGDSTVIAMAHDGALQALPEEMRAEQHDPFIAHMTARYGAVKKLTFTGPITFDRLTVAMGEETYDFPLGVAEKSIDEARVEIKRMRATGNLITSVFGVRDALTGFPQAADRVATKNRIVRSARRLNVTNLLPDGWLAGEQTPAEIGMDLEVKVMSPDPHAMKLREYWAHGKGRTKWKPGVPGDFKRLRHHLAKYVQNPHILDGLTANIHKLATGVWPGPHAHGGHKSMATISAEEFKAALLLTDPDADLELGDDIGMDGVSEEDEPESDEEDALYEQALVDETGWELGPDGEVTPEDEAEVDDPNSPDGTESPSGPRPVGFSLF
jgi:2'-5' RNA ligase